VSLIASTATRDRLLRTLAAALVVLVGAGPLATRGSAAATLTMDARALFQGHARAGAWMAIDVQLANSGPAITGELRLVDTSGSSRSRYGTTVDLPTTSNQRYVLYAQPPQFGRTVTIELVVGGTTLAKRDVAYVIHDSTQLIVGVVAERPQGVISQVDLGAGPTGAVPAVVALMPADLPARVEGWAAIDRLVWQDVEANQLTPEQLSAMRGWIAAGGHLVIAAGTAGIGVLSGFPDELLPYRPTATVNVAPALLRDLLGGIPADAPDTPAMGGSLRAGNALATSGDRAIAAEMTYGSGQVTLLGVDPTTPWIAESTDTSGLWRRLLPARTAGGPVITGDDSQMLSAVQTLPELALPPIGGLIVLLAIYIVLIGPVNYLVLRRIDRRELAWVTMPALIAVFAVGAYAYGALSRGSELIVNEAAIVRGAPETTEGMAQVYLGVFSPTRGIYQLEVPGGALLAAPYAAEFFGSSNASLDVLQGEPARVRDLSIGYANVTAVRAEVAASVPKVSADVSLSDGFLQGTITNQSDRTIEQAAVVLGSTVAVIGDLAPGAERTIRAALVTTQFGQALSDTILGPLFYDGTGASSTYQLSNMRHSILNQLTYDPSFGFTSGLSAETPVFLGWDRDSVVDVRLEGQSPRRTGTTLYYIPLPMTVSGAVTFGPGLVRSTTISVDALFFTKDPSFINIGAGSITIAYNPIAFQGNLAASELRLALNFGGEVLPGGTATSIEPLTEIPLDCTDPASTVPEGCVARIQDGLPEVELFDRTGSGLWVRLPHLSQGISYAISDPGRYVDPATGQVLVRYVNPTVDSNVGFSASVTIGGVVR
jgi:hypothetical protein